MCAVRRPAEPYVANLNSSIFDSKTSLIMLVALTSRSNIYAEAVFEKLWLNHFTSANAAPNSDFEKMHFWLSMLYKR